MEEDVVTDPRNEQEKLRTDQYFELSLGKKVPAALTTRMDHVHTLWLVGMILGKL